MVPISTIDLVRIKISVVCINTVYETIQPYLTMELQAYYVPRRAKIVVSSRNGLAYTI